jgi:hypothetical protein
MRHLTCDPSVEVLGVNVLGIADNMRADEISPFLEKHGLLNVQPMEWYPCQQWLNAMNDLAEHTNLMSNLVAIGLKVAENVVLPPDLANASLTQMLELWNDIYQMQHRGGDIGQVITEKIGDKHYKTTHVHLYPDDLTYGVGYGFARRFLPTGTQFTVSYDEVVPRMDQGGTETIIYVKWG